MNSQHIQKMPDAIKIEYELDQIDFCYKVTSQPLGFNRLPPVFKIEKTQQTDRIKAPLIVRGRNGKWDNTILTGLVQIAEGLQFGDHYTGQKNYMVFSFSPDKQHVEVFYHRGFYPHAPQWRNRVNNHYKEYHQKRWPE